MSYNQQSISSRPRDHVSSDGWAMIDGFFIQTRIDPVLVDVLDERKVFQHLAYSFGSEQDKKQKQPK